MKFSTKDREMFERIVDYFIRAEEEEINALSLSNANEALIRGAQEKLQTLKTVKTKVASLLY